jgi:hypothetical protein
VKPGNNGGPCAQHYYVNRLRLVDGAWLDLRDWDAMFFPLSKKSALVTVVNPENILAGMPSLSKLSEGYGPRSVELKAIEYTVTACRGGKFLTEDFLHEFKKAPKLTRAEDSFLLWSWDGLFTTRPLNDMLSTSAFGAVEGVQFCC